MTLYHICIMKINSLFVYIFLIVLSVSAAFADTTFSDAKTAVRTARESTAYRTEVCRRIILNFNRDSSFVRGLNNYCIYNDTFLINFKAAVYPQTNNNYKGYPDIYPLISSSFIVDSNETQIKTLQRLVKDYCKYNSFRLQQKDPNVCSQERINSLFAR